MSTESLHLCKVEVTQTSEHEERDDVKEMLLRLKGVSKVFDMLAHRDEHTQSLLVEYDSDATKPSKIVSTANKRGLEAEYVSA